MNEFVFEKLNMPCRVITDKQLFLNFINSVDEIIDFVRERYYPKIDNMGIYAIIYKLDGNTNVTYQIYKDEWVEEWRNR